MSIKEMIREHPQVGNDYNEQLAEAVKHAMYCAAICNSCADACSAEDMDMRACIRLCSDCSDVCEATYRVASRRTAGDVKVIEAMLQACITACERCASECDRHDTDHCRRCAKMCRECAEDCRKALEGMKAHA
ncbi:four-helix bundle copper-binding protein [Tsuneonella sp. YG55]|uniref:Four-helix bundle copper-binding protein n=1 Tax=Tsuneonella litorea TaxID=2976475 RepID=A0A9X3AL01_9SPHN|nr:four-helix bundle copper-binding protein [Tsuneonella litorea]MCT2558588.1 four-helix bundle copper-binding protein [Tsuneonella litorea]